MSSDQVQNEWYYIDISNTQPSYLQLPFQVVVQLLQVLIFLFHLFPDLLLVYIPSSLVRQSLSYWYVSPSLQYCNNICAHQVTLELIRTSIQITALNPTYKHYSQQTLSVQAETGWSSCTPSSVYFAYFVSVYQTDFVRADQCHLPLPAALHPWRLPSLHPRQISSNHRL